MMGNKILVLLLILSSSITFSYSECERKIFYYPLRQYPVSTYNLNCSNIYLNKTTQFNTEFTKDRHEPRSLTIIESYIPEIYDNSFEGYQHFLTDVTFSNISLHTIKPNAFLNWNDLERLKLPLNELTTLDFYLPSSVRELYITHNKISDIKGIQNYTNLIIIDLSNNLITDVIDLRPIINLNHLDLSHNNISGLANTTWINGNHLNYLSLSHNNLSNVLAFIESMSINKLNLSHNNISTFNCLKVTESIDMSFNNITEISNFSSTIEWIDFSFNKITHIYEHTFKNLNNLTSLNLSANSIETIFSGIFDDLFELEILDLSNNEIHELPTGLFYHSRSLTQLSIASNYISKFFYGTFTGLRLTFLDVSDNEMENLDTIYPLKYLIELNIKYNYIYVLDVDEILHHLRHLSKINFITDGGSCETLMLYMLKFKEAHIKVEKGDYFYSNNINGIYCSSYQYIKNRNESDEQRMGYVGNYLSSITIALIIILVILIFVIILTSFTLYRVYMKHRRQIEIDGNLHTCSLKLLSENDPLN